MFGINPQLDAFWAGVLFGVLLLVAHYLTSVQVDHGPMRYQRWSQAFKARYVMSRSASYARAEDAIENAPESQTATTPATSNNALQSGATNSNDLLLGQARALAAMVKAGKIGETEGIKLVFGVSPSSTNARYQAARSALKAELERLNSNFPNMTPEQKQAREVLGIGKP